MFDKTNTHFTKFNESTNAMLVIDASDVFEQAVLKPTGITLDQYNLMQQRTNQLQDAVALSVKPDIEEAFKDNPELTNIQVHCTIHRTDEHELINHLTITKEREGGFKVNSRIGRDESYVGLCAEVIKLYEEINN